MCKVLLRTLVPSATDVQLSEFKLLLWRASEKFASAMDALIVLAVRHTFPELLTARGGDANQRKTRSEGPQARMSSLPRRALEADVVVSDAEADRCTHHVIFADGLGNSLEASGAEPSACPTPWSSLCGDWGYQGDVSQFETSPVQTSCLVCARSVIERSTEAVAPWSSVCCNWNPESAPVFELETVPEPGDVREMPTALGECPETTVAWSPWAKRGAVESAVPASSAAEDRAGQLASTSPPNADRYLAALMTFSNASPQPCGKTLAIQKASRAPVGQCAAGRQTATSSSAKAIAAADI